MILIIRLMLDLVDWRDKLRLSFSYDITICNSLRFWYDVVANSKHFCDIDPGLSFGYNFRLFVALELLLLITSLGTRLVVDLIFIVLRCIACTKPVGFVNSNTVIIVLFNISLESIRVYHDLICLPLIILLNILLMNHLVFWCFFFGLSMVLNLFDDPGRLRCKLRNLFRPFQAFFIQNESESWGPQ